MHMFAKFTICTIGTVDTLQALGGARKSHPNGVSQRGKSKIIIRQILSSSRTQSENFTTACVFIMLLS